MRRGETWQGWGAIPAALVLVLLFGGAVAEAARSSLEGGGTAFARVLASDELLPSLLLTWRISLASTVLACALGLSLALALRQVAGTKGGAVARVLLQVPLPVPQLVVAIAMLMLLSQAGLVGRLLAVLGFGPPDLVPDLVNDRLGVGIVLAYVWKEAPFVAVLVLSALRGETLRLEEAARNLGARWWMVWRDVTVPAALPALRTSGALVFAYAFGAFEVPRLLGQTRPSMLGVWSFRLYTDINLARRPEGMVVALLICASAALAALLAAGTGASRGRPR